MSKTVKLSGLDKLIYFFIIYFNIFLIYLIRNTLIYF